MLASHCGLIYAFVCLDAWYLTRVTPLARSGFARLVLTHLAGAIFATELWVLSARFLVKLLFAGDPASLMRIRFPAEVPVIVAMGVMLYLLAVAFYYVVLALASVAAKPKRASWKPGCSPATPSSKRSRPR